MATYGPESSAVEAAQEVQLAAQPGNTNFITPGAWLQVPQSPRHRCEAFEVIIYGVTGDDPPGQHEDGLQLFDIRLLYDTDILELDTPESDVPAAVCISSPCALMPFLHAIRRDKPFLNK